MCILDPRLLSVRIGELVVLVHNKLSRDDTASIALYGNKKLSTDLLVRTKRNQAVPASGLSSRLLAGPGMFNTQLRFAMLLSDRLHIRTHTVSCLSGSLS